MPAERDGRLYRFDPPDGAGVFLGLGVAQCALVGGGLLVSVAATTAGAPILAAVVPAVLGIAAAFARLGGRTAWEWAAVLGSWSWARVGRGRRWLVPVPLLLDGEKTPLPPCLAGLSVVEVPWRGRQRLGAVADSVAHTLTAAVRVASSAFVVASRAEQDRLVGGWGDLLNQFATEGSAVAHVSWSDAARPSGLGQHHQWLVGARQADVDHEAAASYSELLADASRVATAHEVVVTITVSRDRLGRRRNPGGGDEALGRALASSVEALLRGARDASLVVGDPLSAAEIRRLLRARTDPFSTREGAVGGRLVERLGLVSASGAGPMALETRWDSVRIDGAWHRIFLVAGWPRVPVGPAWLEPFLAGAGLNRTMTVYCCPVSAYRSRRAIERDLVKLDSDAAVREDKGRRVDARHRRATQALLEREAELVSGFAEMRYVGLVGVAATDEEALDAAAEEVCQAGREAGLELRSLDGRQDLAWGASLPLGLAPRHLLA
ncbi:MAG TPA: SCO6880 family protein [Acidimicrobiales bacterium]|nr:SCO6880 family protein [Acidimicrobiales bacterium]